MPTSLREHGQFWAAKYRLRGVVLLLPLGRRTVQENAFRAGFVIAAMLMVFALCPAYAQEQSAPDTAERAQTSSTEQGRAQSAGQGKSTKGGASKSASTKSKKRDFRPSERIGVGTAVPFPVDI